ncbi:uncharacterized protein LOC108864059, partial [Galendromus occidentalis]|uniref:Uncharacterized protein LOC108864059 n=1 Tax=Galendromus occidentalis TaxID=34638 RepID=A0AAJ7L567_9ACAR
MQQNHLELAPQKCEAVMLLKKRTDGDSDIKLRGETIRVETHVKYLGIILEQNLTGKTHIEERLKKATQVAMSTARILPRTFGASETQRRLLAAVSESIALYAAPIWAPSALVFSKYRDKLDRTQRVMAIRITRAYRTNSTEADLVLARTTPWALLAKERSQLYEEKKRISRQEGSAAIGTAQTGGEQIRNHTVQAWQERNAMFNCHRQWGPWDLGCGFHVLNAEMPSSDDQAGTRIQTDIK